MNALPLGLDPVSLPDDAVEVGRIAEAWGIQGWFKVHPYSASPEALFSSKRWFIGPPSIRQGRAVEPHDPSPIGLLRILNSKTHAAGIVAKAELTPDRTAAEQLKGWRVFVPRSSFPTPDSDEFYWVDLMGLQVWNREGVHLGQVIDLMSTGPHDVLVLQPPDSMGKPASDTCLIPFVKAHVDEVDLAAGRIVVDWQLDY